LLIEEELRKREHYHSQVSDLNGEVETCEKELHALQNPLFMLQHEYYDNTRISRSRFVVGYLREFGGSADTFTERAIGD
jgi:hypothetical protein